jgi:hypothetical protein
MMIWPGEPVQTAVPATELPATPGIETDTTAGSADDNDE